MKIVLLTIDLYKTFPYSHNGKVSLWSLMSCYMHIKVEEEEFFGRI